jgi:hypothetical protein
MRGWFHLVSATCAETKPPTCRAFSKKRLKGFEPSTFCMAIRPTPGKRPLQNMPICRDFIAATANSPDQQYAGICAGMQRVGHSCARVPEIRGGSLIFLAPNRYRRMVINPAGDGQVESDVRPPRV